MHDLDPPNGGLFSFSTIVLLLCILSVEYQEQADSFEGAKALLAAALATKLGNHIISTDTMKHSMGDPPDPLAVVPQNEGYVSPKDPNYHKTRKSLENAAEAISQRYDPEFTNKDSLRRKSNTFMKGGSTTTYTKDHIPNLHADRVYQIEYNPDLDRAIYAHELGHTISQNSKVGNKIAQLKHELNRNHKLGEFLETQMARMPAGVAAALAPVMTSPKVMAAGRLALPTAIAAAIPGDDDAMAAVAANLVLSSPELIDEFLASKNALEVMKDAGMPATFKQRARMAGAWGSYLAKPLTAALIGNVAGNVIEDI